MILCANPLTAPPTRSLNSISTAESLLTGWMVTYLAIHGALGAQNLGAKIEELRAKNKLLPRISWDEIEFVCERFLDLRFPVRI